MNKVINWFCGSFIRTIGRFVAFIVIGMLVASLISANNIKFDISSLLGIQRVSASTFDTLWVPLYSDSNRSQSFNTATLTSNINNNMTTTRFYFANNKNLHYFNGKDYTGGQLKMPFTLTVPILSLQNSNTINGTDVCDRWEYYTITTNENVLAWSCEHWSSNSDSSINDREFIFPTTSLKATLHTLKDNVSFYVSCQIKDNSIYCPIGEQQEILDYIDIETNVQYGSTSLTKQYTFNFDNFVQIEYDGTTSAINNQTTTITNNQNANTNATIENQNQNTQSTIDSQKVCNFYDKNSIINNGYLLPNGNSTTDESFGVSDYIPFQKNSSILEVLVPYSWADGAHFCQYDVNKNLLGCNQLSSFTDNFVFNSSVNYIRVSINKTTNKPQFRVCTNGNQSLANTLTDNNISDNDVSSELEFDVPEQSLGPFSSFLTLPLTWIQTFLGVQSCSDLVLPLPFLNKSLTLPCMDGFWSSMGLLGALIQACWLAVVGVRIFNGLFMLVVEVRSPEGNSDYLTKIRSWEL